MDVQTLLNSLSTGGFQVLPHGSAGVAVVPATGLSGELCEAIRLHKTTLRQLVSQRDDYELAEREAIQFADAGGVGADMALIRARFELQEIIEPPSACDHCGALVFRWDLTGERHCIACEPGKSGELLRIAEAIRHKHAYREIPF